MAALMNGQRQRLGDKLGSLLPTIPRWGLELVIRQWLPAHPAQESDRLHGIHRTT
jgi:hypothetical protein